MKEIVFSNLESLVNEKDNVSRNRSKKTWEAVDYETGKINGVMLVAPQGTSPEEVTISLGLKGWYKIYLGMLSFNYDQTTMYTYFKLDSDKAFSGLYPRPEGRIWHAHETVDEFLWKCAKLDGDKLHIAHPDTSYSEISAVLWVRCVEMSDEEVKEHLDNKKGEFKIHAHIDTDFMGHDNLKSPSDALTIIQHLENTDVTMCSQEVAFDLCGYFDEMNPDDYMGIRTADKPRNKAYLDFYKFREESYCLMQEFCRNANIRLHAQQRMQISSFQYPTTYPLFKIKYVDENPQYYIKTRDDRSVKILSYAYDEVQDFVINSLIETYKLGFDGITLAWIRGVSFGFEQPIIDKVYERFGIDARKLAISDERLNSVLCEILTGFMRKLRNALVQEAEKSKREKCNINVIVPYTPELSRHLGLDVEAWSKEGLIDGITAGLYAHYENLEGCFDEDGLINIEKYKEQVKERFILTRQYDSDIKLMCQGIEEYEKIAKKYDVETYYAVDWEGENPEIYAKEAKAFYEKGAKGIFTWDTNSRVKYPPEWAVTSKLGSMENCENAAEKYNSLRKSYRLLKIGKNDISYVCANWRG